MKTLILIILFSALSLAQTYDVGQTNANISSALVKALAQSDSNTVYRNALLTKLAISTLNDSNFVLTSEMDLAPGLIQDSLDVKLNRSEYTAGGTDSATVSSLISDSLQANNWDYLDITDTVSTLATIYDLSQVGAADTSHYVAYSKVLGLEDSIGNAINDSSLATVLQFGIPAGNAGSWTEFSKDAFTDSLDLVIGDIAFLQDSLTAKQVAITNIADTIKYLEKSDSSIYATQYDIAGLTGDTTHYVAFNKVIGLQDTVDALRALINTILNEGDPRVPFMWAYLTLDTLGTDPEFPSQSDVALGTVITSDTMLVGSNDVGRVKLLTTGEYNVKYNTTLWSGWQTTEGYYKAIDSVAVRDTSSTANSTETLTIIQIAGIVDTFSVTTLAGVLDTTPTAPPTSFLAIGGTSATQFNNTWTDPVEADLDSIRFYGGTANDTTTMVWIASIDEAVESYLWTGRDSGTTYWCAVKAIDDSGNVSYFSNVDSATTIASGGATPFYTLDFEEGIGTDWTSEGANVSYDVSAAHGDNYGLRLTSSSGTLSYYTFSNRDSVYVQFWFYMPDATVFDAGGYTYCAYFDSSGSTDRSYFGGQANADSSNKWTQWLFGATSGSMGASPANFSRNAWHEITVFYKKGTGANSIHRMWVDGTLTHNVTSGTLITVVNNWRLGIQVRTATGYIYFDNIKFYDENPLGY